MAVKFADLEIETEIAPSPEPDGLALAAHPNAAKTAIPETSPSVRSEEYKLLYLPTMVSVYTARHQRMPESAELLREHVFGTAHHAGCDACREETEFLVAHQKKFF